MQLAFVRPNENLVEYLEKLMEAEENEDLQETIMYTSCSLLNRLENSEKLEENLLDLIGKSMNCKSAVKCKRILINCIGALGADQYFDKLIEQVEILEDRELKEMAVKLIGLVLLSYFKLIY